MSDKVRRKGRGIGRPVRCGAHLPGHDVHYIQMGLSLRANADVEVFVTAVDDDGTIHFADGRTAWEHQPERLRKALEKSGGRARIGAYQVLKVPSRRGDFCFYLGDGPTPCPGASAEPTSLEGVVGELRERGGFVVSGEAVVRMMGERGRAGR